MQQSNDHKDLERKSVFMSLFQKWEKLKQCIASYLGQKSASLSVSVKKRLLFLFCILLGGSSVAMIIGSVTAKTNVVNIKPISQPKNIQQEQEQAYINDSIITEEAYNRVELVKQYLLELSNTTAGKIRYDSILQQRPHLLDSIALFEKMYLSQQ